MTALFRCTPHFDTMTDFLELVIRDFAKGAPQHHHLVFKAHPLEDGRVPVRKSLKEMARAFWRFGPCALRARCQTCAFAR